MEVSAQENISLPFENSYGGLPDRFYARLHPKIVKEPSLIKLNSKLIEFLGLDENMLSSKDGIDVIAGNKIAQESSPLAMAYAGHQFGHFVPQLGDGRALLLGEMKGADGHLYDVQLKGSGPTPFSRMGDGRAALGPVIREYLVSEAMHALGVPTTRSLAAVKTGEPVVRHDVHPGAVLTRVARSHVRVGTFQYFAARQDADAIRLLADFVIDRLYPDVKQAENPYVALLESVMERQASLIAKWLSYGFIHGVMNTDNMAISGETIDYGPCAFMDTYHPNKVFSSVDQMGRYAFGNQPTIGQWNLIRFAECLLSLFDADEKQAIEKAQGVIDKYSVLFHANYMSAMTAKLGISDFQEKDVDLIKALLTTMADNEIDFTLFFFHLTGFAASGFDETLLPDHLFKSKSVFLDWSKGWQVRLMLEETEPSIVMQQSNPSIIPRNHQVEAAIRAAEDDGDFTTFHDLLSALENPFKHRSLESDPFVKPPKSAQVVHQTFCGT